MIRWVLITLLAVALAAYAFWIYLRVDLPVPSARRLATLRTCAFIVVLLLLFDVRLPSGGPDRPERWALVDASLSMAVVGVDGARPWDEAIRRADELRRSGYEVEAFGADPASATPDDPDPTELSTRLLPALERAAEGGARTVVVLTDGRIEDEVALRAAAVTLPLELTMERFGDERTNAGVTRLSVSDVPRPGDPARAEVEIHASDGLDSVTVEVLAEGDLVAATTVAAPDAGLRATVPLDFSPPVSEGRVRYEARVTATGDAFSEDDVAVDYATIGREEGALVLVSLRPDWEPRYLLSVLSEVTGLPTTGYVAAGPDRWVRAGRALDRSGPVDTEAVRTAVADAELVVLQGLDAGADEWAWTVAEGAGRRILLPTDAASVGRLGLNVASPVSGEWYASADLPPSPVAGALAGVSLQGLPPLTDVMASPGDPGADAPVLLQHRGAGPAVPALRLVEGRGRTAIVLASGFWRWASRDVGRDAYRRLWSGVAGWILSGRAVAAGDVRPTQWVVERGEPVGWNVPDGASGVRLVVGAEGGTTVDTVVSAGASVSTGTLPPGTYEYAALDPSGDTLGSGRFDVAGTTREMSAPRVDELPAGNAAAAAARASTGRPIRTASWPYLLLIGLLCAEWVGRRRSGLR